MLMARQAYLLPAQNLFLPLYYATIHPICSEFPETATSDRTGMEQAGETGSLNPARMTVVAPA